MQTKHLSWVAIGILSLLVWRIIYIENELSELRRAIVLRGSAPAFSSTGAGIASSSSFPDSAMRPEASFGASSSGKYPVSSFVQGPIDPEFSSDPAGAAPVQKQKREEFEVLKDQVAMLENSLADLSDAWNKFADDEEGGRRQKTPAASWSPEQAIGAPDTSSAGDYPTAWASLAPDGGMEWLQADYAQPVEVAQVKIIETHNPGAVVKITGITSTGGEVILWQGNEPQLPAPAQQVFTIPPGMIVGSVRVHLDTKKVPGWNEIDAVELIGRNGSHQWASGASASSTYANSSFGFGRAFQ